MKVPLAKKTKPNKETKKKPTKNETKQIKQKKPETCKSHDSNSASKRKIAEIKISRRKENFMRSNVKSRHLQVVATEVEKASSQAKPN